MDDNDKLNIFDQFFMDVLNEAFGSGSRRKKTSRTVMVSYDDDVDYSLKNGILAEGDNAFKTQSILDFLSSDDFLKYLKNIATTYLSEYMFLELFSGRLYPKDDDNPCINVNDAYSKIDPYQSENFGGSRPGLIPIKTVFGNTIELNIPSIILCSFYGTRSLIRNKDIKLESDELNKIGLVGQRLENGDKVDIEAYKKFIERITYQKINKIINYLKSKYWDQEVENMERAIHMSDTFGTRDEEEFQNGIGLFLIYDDFLDVLPYSCVNGAVKQTSTGKDFIYSNRFVVKTREDRKEREEIIRSILDNNEMWSGIADIEHKKFTDLNEIEIETPNVNVEKLFSWLVNDCGVSRNKLLSCPGFSVTMNNEVGSGTTDEAVSNRAMLTNKNFERLETPVMANRKIKQGIEEGKTFSEILFKNNFNLPQIKFLSNVHNQYIAGRIVAYDNLRTAFSRTPVSLAEFYSTLHSTLSFVKELSHIYTEDRNKLESSLSKKENLTDANVITYSELKNATIDIANSLKNVSPVMADAVQYAEFIDPLTDNENKSVRTIRDYENKKYINVSLVSDNIDDIIERNRLFSTIRLFDAELVKDGNRKRETTKGSITRMVSQILNDYVKIDTNYDYRNEKNGIQNQINLVISSAVSDDKKPKVSVRYKVTEEAIDSFLAAHKSNINNNESSTSNKIGDYINDNLNSFNLEISYVWAGNDAGGGRKDVLKDNMSISVTKYVNDNIRDENGLPIKARSVKIKVPLYPNDIIGIVGINNKGDKWRSDTVGFSKTLFEEVIQKIKEEANDPSINGNSTVPISIKSDSSSSTIDQFEIFRIIVERTIANIISFKYPHNVDIRKQDIEKFATFLSTHFIPAGNLPKTMENDDNENISNLYNDIMPSITVSLENLQYYIRFAWTYYEQVNSDLGYFSDKSHSPKSTGSTSKDEIEKYLKTRCNVLRQNQATIQAASTSRAKLAAYIGNNAFAKTEGFGTEINQLVLKPMEMSNSFRTFERNYKYIVNDKNSKLYNFYQETLYPTVVLALFEMFNQPVQNEKFESGIKYDVDLNHIANKFIDLIDRYIPDQNTSFDESFKTFATLFDNELNNSAFDDDDKVALRNITTAFFDQCYLLFLVLLACGGKANRRAGIPTTINTPGVGEINIEDEGNEEAEEETTDFSFEVFDPPDEAAGSKNWIEVE